MSERILSLASLTVLELSPPGSGDAPEPLEPVAPEADRLPAPWLTTCAEPPVAVAAELSRLVR